MLTCPSWFKSADKKPWLVCCHCEASAVRSPMFTEPSWLASPGSTLKRRLKLPPAVPLPEG